MPLTSVVGCRSHACAGRGRGCPAFSSVIRQSKSSEGRTGLVRLPANPRGGPRRRPGVRSKSSAGTALSSRSPGRALACSANSMPSMPGILRSTTPKSKSCRPSAARGRSPGPRSRRSASTDFDAPGAELLAQDLAVGGVVVDDQGPLAARSAGRRRRLRRRQLSRSAQRQLEPEGRPFARGAVEPSLPPISSTSCRQIASPSPVPPNLRVVEESAWAKARNRRSWSSAAMPMPVSITSKRSGTRVGVLVEDARPG